MSAVRSTVTRIVAASSLSLALSLPAAAEAGPCQGLADRDRQAGCCSSWPGSSCPGS